LCDDAAPQLEARRQLARIEAPLVGDETEPLDGLEVGERGIHFVDDGLVFGAHFGICDQLLSRGGGDAMLFGPWFEGGKVGSDKR
jgi:hypothetical protein